MTHISLAILVNLLGFTVGIALYAMLFIMALRRDGNTITNTGTGYAQLLRLKDPLLFATAVLGLLWNIGSLVTYGLVELGLIISSSWLIAISFSALGFLPAVVVHSVIESNDPPKSSKWILLLSYSLSLIGSLMHFGAFWLGHTVPSRASLIFLTVGFCFVMVMLFLLTMRQPGWKRAVWAVALGVFAVSAVHLSQHGINDDSWLIELSGHHASLPLALAILYQDYRFAFADIFLKRALALLSVVASVCFFYLLMVDPLISIHEDHLHMGPRAILILLGTWIASILIFPFVQQFITLVVDRVILQRADYNQLQSTLLSIISKCEKDEAVLNETCNHLAKALTAQSIEWARIDSNKDATLLVADRNKQSGIEHLQYKFVNLSKASKVSACVQIPTTDQPQFKLIIGKLAGGRRLLSDDIEMLNSIALIVARRIDALRVTHERCEHALREQEISKLATEAQLRALRAQINPHFLFNALTTIGYLIKTAPDRAFDTLMRLTDLLRALLKTTDEFVSLSEEIRVIKAYLDIELARFEERLSINIDIPPQLMMVRIPSLIIQPLVENAIKHGISPAKLGGAIEISAKLVIDSKEGFPSSNKILCITVQDTGVGTNDIKTVCKDRQSGIGLSNIRERLNHYYGSSASLNISSLFGKGTIVEIKFPLVTSTAYESRMFTDVERI